MASRRIMFIRATPIPAMARARSPPRRISRSPKSMVSPPPRATRLSGGEKSPPKPTRRARAMLVSRPISAPRKITANPMAKATGVR